MLSVTARKIILPNSLVRSLTAKSSLSSCIRSVSSVPPSVSSNSATSSNTKNSTPYNHQDDSTEDTLGQRRRQLHTTARTEQDVTAPTTSAVTEEEESKETTEVTTSNPLVDRFIVTAEVTVSKIFPAGFGWQSASVLAAAQGYDPNTMAFALTTGAGDAVGVFAGHCAYYAGKKAMLGAESINMVKEAQTGLLLGTAAFCSGTAWQPIVNALQGANLPFMQVFGGTWLGCGAAFYVGLRLGRTFLSGPFEHIEEPTYENSKNDVSLSAAIGGATGFFVGTDAAYLPDQNFLIHAVGIQPNTSDLMGCAIAGTSTSMGFLTSQSVMNVSFPTGKCWND